MCESPMSCLSYPSSCKISFPLQLTLHDSTLCLPLEDRRDCRYLCNINSWLWPTRTSTYIFLGNDFASLPSIVSLLPFTVCCGIVSFFLTMSCSKRCCIICSYHAAKFSLLKDVWKCSVIWAPAWSALPPLQHSAWKMEKLIRAGGVC